MEHSHNEGPYKHQQADLSEIPVSERCDVPAQNCSEYRNRSDPCHEILEERKVLVQGCPWDTAYNQNHEYHDEYDDGILLLLCRLLVPVHFDGILFDVLLPPVILGRFCRICLHLIRVPADINGNQAQYHNEQDDTGQHPLPGADSRDSGCHAHGKGVDDGGKASALCTEYDNHNRYHRIQTEGHDDGHKHQHVDDPFLIAAFRRPHHSHDKYQHPDQHMVVCLEFFRNVA